MADNDKSSLGVDVARAFVSASCVARRGDELMIVRVHVGTRGAAVVRRSRRRRRDAKWRASMKA